MPRLGGDGHGRPDLADVVRSNDLDRWRRDLTNDFEAPVVARHPALGRVRAALADQVKLQQDDGRIRPDLDADQVAALVIAASDGLQTQWLLDPDVDQEGALALLDRLLGDVPPPMETEDGSPRLA